MITNAIAQLRTTDLAASIRFYTETLGLALAFQFRDFYAGIRAGSQMIHLKQVDAPDPTLDFIRAGEHFHLYLETDDIDTTVAMLKDNGVQLIRDVHATGWGARECTIEDDQGHTIYIAQASAADAA